MSSPRVLRRAGTKRLLGVGALVVLLLGGCTSVRNNLGTADSPCYLALPAATRSVGTTSRLVGVHLTTLKTVARDSDLLADALHITNRSVDRACVFEFTGRFTHSSVSSPRGHVAGRFAVVVLTSPGNRLLGTVILNHSPFRFGHPHFG